MGKVMTGGRALGAAGMLGALLALAGCLAPEPEADRTTPAPTTKPATKPATPELRAASAAPVMRWDHRPEAREWTAAALAAVMRDGQSLTATVPEDIAAFCPSYAAGDRDRRALFWVGFMSALAKHESTWNPRASGGGGKWHGLLQIAPITWRHYGCSGDVFNGADNLACSVKIMDYQVGRDGAIVKTAGAGGWRGVARDWGPMRQARKLADIKAWTSRQDYCQP